MPTDEEGQGSIADAFDYTLTYRGATVAFTDPITEREGRAVSLLNSVLKRCEGPANEQNG
jgi:hypothetical protein